MGDPYDLDPSHEDEEQWQERVVNDAVAGEHVLRASLVKPIAAGTIRAAAAAWVAILAIRPFAEHGDAATDDSTPDLPALARLICGGLSDSALA